ncbi:MAG: hypothetical protein CJBNEKGG_02876 [Prosthecobacter sp.]|nr:hypothetical protein [Prosthecobacter sp.]
MASHPLQRHMLTRHRPPADSPQSAAKRMQENLTPLIIVQHRWSWNQRLHLAAKFFFQLPVQGRLRRLPRLNFTTWKLPKTSQPLSSGPFGHQHQPIPFQDGTDDLNRVLRGHRLHEIASHSRLDSAFLTRDAMTRPLTFPQRSGTVSGSSSAYPALVRRSSPRVASLSRRSSA